MENPSQQVQNDISILNNDICFESVELEGWTTFPINKNWLSFDQL